MWHFKELSQIKRNENLKKNIFCVSKSSKL